MTASEIRRSQRWERGGPRRLDAVEPRATG
jgi:hypothetical protein